MAKEPEDRSLEALLRAYVLDDPEPSPPTLREPGNTLPFNVGRTDHARGVGFEDCPYVAEHGATREWRLGWRASEKAKQRATGGPYVAGLQARQQNQRLASNPHPVGSIDANVWDRGWHDGAE